MNISYHRVLVFVAITWSLLALPRVLRAQTSDAGDVGRAKTTPQLINTRHALTEIRADISLGIAAWSNSDYYAILSGRGNSKTELARSFKIGTIPSLETSSAKSTDGTVAFGLWGSNWRWPTRKSRKFSSSVILPATPVHSDYDTLVTRRENGVESWYLGCVEGEGDDLPLQGKRIKWNYFMQPMARIRGRFLLPDLKSWASISYHDPRLIYQQWATETSQSFEIFAPVGDVTLNFRSGEKTGELLLKNLKAHETREIEFSFDPKI